MTDLDASPPEPDYRFTLANERTYLAWVRTGLALMAAGVAVVHLSSAPGAAALALGLTLAALGGVMNATAYRSWQRNDTAIRLGRPLPASRVPRLVSACLGLVTATAIVVLIVAPQLW